MYFKYLMQILEKTEGVTKLGVHKVADSCFEHEKI